MPKLWRYNLHYFDYLHDSQRSYENKVSLITDWIRQNPPGTKDAWEPYTVSLRIVNWIKFFLVGKDPDTTASQLHPGFDEEWLGSLYRQARWLEENIEYHILANHYLKNGKALFFAGVFFEGEEAGRWLREGLRILREEAEEQFLSDGGHYERSLMYHVICLEDYLDVLNLMILNPGIVSQEVVTHFSRKATWALDFLHDVCLPDGEIPLFNDAAVGIAPAPVDVFDYANRITGYERTPPQGAPIVIEKTQSGYFGMRNGGDMVLIDCGPMGPDYQPGHAHCDTLSFELVLNGRRVIVDSGVFDYEPSQKRAYARSTRAHNTLLIDGQDQSEVWGVFRLARRATPIEPTIARLPEGGVRFEGTHDGYRRLPGRVMHTRVIEWNGRESWTVLDEVIGGGRHEAQSYIHLHPEYTLKKMTDRIEIIQNNGKAVGRLVIIGEVSTRVEVGQYFPEFGREYETEVVVLSCSGPLPLKFGYRISKEL